jgi:hypothetical protein
VYATHYVGKQAAQVLSQMGYMIFGAYLRGYIGPNPHGQFRNIPLYNFVGLSFIYEL